MKQVWKPGTMIYPLPAVLVSCGDNEISNFLTVAWTGTICTDPAMCYISVRPERYSHELIKRHMEFTINLTTGEMARATDWAGVRSGKDFNKWKETGLTPEPGVADEKWLDPQTGKFTLEQADPLVYTHGGYYRQGEYIGHFGFSVKKKK